MSILHTHTKHIYIYKYAYITHIHEEPKVSGVVKFAALEPHHAWLCSAQREPSPRRLLWVSRLFWPVSYFKVLRSLEEFAKPEPISKHHKSQCHGWRYVLETFKPDAPEIIFLKLTYDPARFALENKNHGKWPKYIHFVWIIPVGAHFKQTSACVAHT